MSKRIPTPIPKYIVKEDQNTFSVAPTSLEHIYINSSNGYLDKQITILNDRVYNLEREIKLLKILLEKQNKQNLK